MNKKMLMIVIYILSSILVNIILKTSLSSSSAPSSTPIHDTCHTLDFLINNLDNESKSHNILSIPRLVPSFPLPLFESNMVPNFDSLVSDIATSEVQVLYTTFENNFHDWISNW